MLFFIISYVRNKKMPPTDEPIVGEYRIELHKGTHIESFEGTLHYNEKCINPKHLYIIAESLSKVLDTESKSKSKQQLTMLQETLTKKENGKRSVYFYAMRQGTRKIGFLSFNHPIEITPFFKPEEGTNRKVVHATGECGEESKGWTYVTMEPVNLSTFELNPKERQAMTSFSNLVVAVKEAAPLIQQIDAEKENNRILRNKADELADEIGKKEDEIQYWKKMYKGKGSEETSGEGLHIPMWLRKYLPLAALFVIGCLVSPAIPQLSGLHPVFLGLGATAAGFIVMKLMGK